MSIYETNLSFFIYLLNTQPQLFSQEYREELSRLITNKHDEVKELSNAISNWLIKYPDINNALKKLKIESGNITLTRVPGSEKPNLNILPCQTDKQALLNAIHESSSGGNNDNNPGSKVSGNPKK